MKGIVELETWNLGAHPFQNSWKSLSNDVAIIWLLEPLSILYFSAICIDVVFVYLLYFLCIFCICLVVLHTICTWFALALGLLFTSLGTCFDTWTYNLNLMVWNGSSMLARACISMLTVVEQLCFMETSSCLGLWIGWWWCCCKGNHVFAVEGVWMKYTIFKHERGNMEDHDVAKTFSLKLSQTIKHYCMWHVM